MKRKMNKKLIIGLGNPGPRYVFTRHNVGFFAIDNYINNKKKFVDFKHFISRTFEAYESKNMILLKPTTFMNLSGQIFVELTKKWGLFETNNIIVIYDDVDIDFGKIRIREKGSSGTHNGMKSIISFIGKDFPRIRIGVGEKPDYMKLSDYVLTNFSDDELSHLGIILDNVDKTIDYFLEDNLEKAMNLYNSKNFILE